MLSRLQAIQDIRCGRGIQLQFTNEDRVGKKNTYNLILRRVSESLGGPYKCEAVIDCRTMRRTYRITLTTKQVLAYIKRHYARYDDFTVQLRHIMTLAEVA